MSPQENGKRYFDKYKKLQSALTYQQEKLDENMANLDDTESLLSHVKEAGNLEELYELAALAGEDFNDKKNNSSNHAGRKFLLSGDFTAYVSRSSRDADVMLKTVARGNDYWFHIRDNAGSHVVIKNKGKNIMKKIIVIVLILASLLAFASLVYANGYEKDNSYNYGYDNGIVYNTNVSANSGYDSAYSYYGGN